MGGAVDPGIDDGGGGLGIGGGGNGICPEIEK